MGDLINTTKLQSGAEYKGFQKTYFDISSSSTMNIQINKKFYFAGTLVPIWLFVGVFIAGSLYPGYSHYNQAMSELGALEAPTHVISPIINNYPLGVLFIIFGIAVFKTFTSSRLASLSGVLIITHGMASIIAGTFSCDVGCNIESTLTSQAIHNVSGLFMFLSLLIASGIWGLISTKVLNIKWFGWLSILLTFIALAALPLMAASIESGNGFGLYQRINYGASVIWLFIFSLVLFFHDS